MNYRSGVIRSLAFFVSTSFLFCPPAWSQPAPAVRNRAVKPSAEEFRNVIMGFSGNRVEDRAVAVTISGGGRSGFPNRVYGNMGTIGGGAGNEAASMATVAGGEGNRASGIRATIAGGEYNAATLDSSTVGGGYGNLAGASHATVAGGISNAAIEVDATVGGGSGNAASERHSTVGGGSVNKAGGFAASIAGGVYNIASATYSTVGGGIANLSKGIESTVSGGAGNRAFAESAFIGGGMNNHVTGPYSTVAGGRANVAGDDASTPCAYATVGGGMGNRASGSYSVVPGGSQNSASGDYSFAAGSRATVEPGHDGVFLYSDHKGFDFPSIGPNEFAVRSTGGVRFVTGIDASGHPLAGVRLSPGSGSWETLSDRRLKTSFLSVDGQEVLERLKTVPIMSWRYKAEDSETRHIGPTAQDFHKAFQLGADERYINGVDADGIAMAAIQSLYEMVKERDKTIEAHENRIREMEASLAAQKRVMAGLEARLQGTKGGAK
jgi:trimeric autotransporter adhesin